MYQRNSNFSIKEITKFNILGLWQLIELKLFWPSFLSINLEINHLQLKGQSFLLTELKRIFQIEY